MYIGSGSSTLLHTFDSIRISIRHGPPPPTKTMVNALLPRECQEVGHGPFLKKAFPFSLKVILAWKNPSLRRAQSVQVARKSRIKVRG